ncbi:helix-turn-helix domain-containing protein [Fodinisporobacter ferrooxydans]|uniref:Helix-turn-helix domain-containing protein n=1 Tax=Fodinisporobacter ferrooxydans TaxID=2901836 RepID=A0ABY4CLW1_9BACL|nr:helix-turn-helix domain-containing protein [Alicyclobacillaceae bacterium MYW30-H2]
MLNLQQKQLAIEEAKKISAMILNDKTDMDKARYFFMAFANYVAKTSPKSDVFTTANLHNINILECENTEEVRRAMKQALEQMLVHVVDVATNELEYAKVYTTGDLATFFGVSVQTINNWINQGRIQPVEKSGRFKQVRISEHAIYTSSRGERMTIKDVVAMYEEEKKKHVIREATPMEAYKELVDSILFFETKYGGEYYKTLGVKSDLSTEEARDAQEWRYLLRKVAREDPDEFTTV